MAQTVTVGCKYPNGLLLELNGVKVAIRGANAANIIGGHGITEGVNKEFMEAWLVQYAENDVVKGGHLFIADKAASVAAEAVEKADHKTGLEPLDPKAKPAGIEAVAE